MPTPEKIAEESRKEFSQVVKEGKVGLRIIIDKKLALANFCLGNEGRPVERAALPKDLASKLRGIPESAINAMCRLDPEALRSEIKELQAEAKSLHEFDKYLSGEPYYRAEARMMYNRALSLAGHKDGGIAIGQAFNGYFPNAHLSRAAVASLGAPPQRGMKTIRETLTPDEWDFILKFAEQFEKL